MTPKYNLLNRSFQLQGELVALRRHLHSYPELSFQERDTARLVAEKLCDLGFNVRRNVGGTGVIGDTGTGKVIAIRAEMDALPLTELNRVPYSSRNQGVMHACGHDANMACVLGAASLLSGMTAPGRVRMLMQPAAEESSDSAGKTGTYRMIEDGALDDVTAIISCHMDTTLPAGKVAIVQEPVMPPAAAFKITVQGKDYRGLSREGTDNPVLWGAQIVSAIHKISTRHRFPIISVGSFQAASSRGDIVSEQIILKGTFHSFSKQMRREIMKELEDACRWVKETGGDYQIAYSPASTPLPDHLPVTSAMHQAAVDLLGQANVLAVKRKSWTEDFSAYSIRIPGALLLLGGEIPASRRCMHSPSFDIDESGLHIGSAILSRTARLILDSQQRGYEPESLPAAFLDHSAQGNMIA